MIVANEKLSWFVRCFVVTAPCLFNLDAGDWCWRLIRRVHVMMMSGTTVAELPCEHFLRKPPLNTQAIAPKDNQTNTR
jgi:hypothetical protein